VRRLPLILTLGLLISGCVIAPKEAKQEKAKMESAGQAYTTTRAAREIPDLPADPTWRDVLQRAMLASGEVESSYYEWAMAVHRIDQRGTWPSQPLDLGYSYMFSSERIKTFNRMTFSAGLDNPQALPNKTYFEAKTAWREAEAAGDRFRQAKFELQSKVLSAWADYAAQAERIRIGEENLGLLRMVVTSTETRVRAGAPQQDLLRAQVELQTAENELGSRRAELTQQQARLNALLVRPADAAIAAPPAQPDPRPLPADDAALLALGVNNNAELASLDKDRLARESAIVRAKLEYLPDVNVNAAFTGQISQMAGGVLAVPTRFPAIRAGIEEARADLRRVEAMRDQRRADRASAFAATLAALRDAERRVRVYTDTILPLASRSLDLTRRGYASGTATYLDVTESQRTLLEVRLMVVDARAMRERMLAELEMLAGADVETLGAPAISPATRPATSPSVTVARKEPPL
jgi:outer membrane protein TolC